MTWAELSESSYGAVVSTLRGRRIAVAQVAWAASLLAMAQACGHDHHPQPPSASAGAHEVGDGGAGGMPAAGAAGGAEPGGAGESFGGAAGESSEPYADCFPFERPRRAQLKDSKKRAFAYYFPQFPISFDNAEPQADHWHELLSPAGPSGGEVRDRPLPRPARDDTEWEARDAELEIRQAVAAGLDGWVMAVPSRDDPAFARLELMLDAVTRIAPDFHVVLSPRAPESPAEDNAGIVAALSAVLEHPALLKTDDDKVVLAPYRPEIRLQSFWDGLRQKLAKPSVFVSIFQTYRGGEHQEFAGLSYAFSSWGARTVADTSFYSTASSGAHALDKLWMQPAALEDVRFGREMVYWEAENTELLRASLQHAIDNEADWLLLTTWNDYASSWLAPSQARGYAPLDLAAYYVAWFKTGAAPPITSDALYYSHRGHLAAASFDSDAQTAGGIRLLGGPQALDQIELVAFLTEPATIRIRQGDYEATLDADRAGIAVLHAPLAVGEPPSFEIERDGVILQHVVSDTPVLERVTYQEFVYHSGGGVECDRPD